MRRFALSCGLQRTLHKVAVDRRGLAAIEFAIILPLMLLLYLGTFELAQGVAAYRLNGLTASTIANLVSQYTTISASQQMPDILNASTAVLSPYPVANATVVVSCVSIDPNGKATISWSRALNGPQRQTGAVVVLPAAFDVPNTSVIWGESTYAYTPLIDFTHMGTLGLYASEYMLPRSSTSIALTS
jgi:Flp pilus assembly protein TadG